MIYIEIILVLFIIALIFQFTIGERSDNAYLSGKQDQKWFMKVNKPLFIIGLLILVTVFIGLGQLIIWGTVGIMKLILT